MKFRAALSIAALAAAPFVASVHADPGTLTVDVANPGVKISPSLYGIFFEEINNGGDGGLYGELLRNRNFEESDKPDHWNLVLGGGAAGSIGIGQRGGADATEFNKRHLTIKCDALTGDADKPTKGDRVGAACDGYWGVPVGPDGAGTLTVRARSSDVKVLRASLENRAGTVYATETIDLTDAKNAGDWITRDINFKNVSEKNAIEPDARLVLSIDRAGSVDIDFVSLMRPKSTSAKNSPVREDLAAKIAALNPAFMRFPGGCWVEGDTMATASRWKRTIGPLWDRWTQPNLWGYQSPNGLGYHEYLQFCEDIGAAGLFVFNVGMSHHGNVPMDQMDEYVQDSLDAIEYALGDETTTWGKKRIEAGHPKPFNLKYVEIGNENGGPAYNERYALFYDAITKKYPQIRKVACDWQGRPGSRPIDLLDEHYYKSPQWFFAKQNQYDDYDRKGPKIYVGEYAVTQGCGAGNLIAALGEAAFMTGMERNSDVVEMCSYAPLFTHIDGKHWNPDLINFDNVRSYGTPSYHVQQMFAANRGDTVLPVKIDRVETAAKAEDTKASGAAGVGTWSTQAEYKDFEVLDLDGKTLYKADLNNDRGWTFNKNGKWRANKGVLTQSGTAENSAAVVGDVKWTDYSVRVKARKLGGDEGFLVSARNQDDGNYVWFNVGGWGNTATAIERHRDFDGETISKRSNFTVETGRWYDLRLDVKGDQVDGYVDGKKIVSGKDAGHPSSMFAATASRDDKSGDIIVKVVNGSADVADMTVKLAGIKDVGDKAKAIVLTGEARDENTIDAPNHVAPSSQDVEVKGTQVQFAFPKYSVTILRVPTK